MYNSCSSIGIILYEIYSRKSPYQGEDFRDVLRKVCNRRVNKRPEIPPAMPPKMVDLMKRCWSHDVQYRPQAKDLDTTLMDFSPQDAEPQQEENRPKKHTKDMLYELFPKHIADSLKRGDKVEPEQHDLVTVVFSDIVHFTDLSHELSPLKVSQMLDRLYLAFDKIAGKHQVFKVRVWGCRVVIFVMFKASTHGISACFLRIFDRLKPLEVRCIRARKLCVFAEGESHQFFIGSLDRVDAYMGVTNLEGNMNDCHAKNIAAFAVDLINEASKILIDEEAPEKGRVNIRVGFHSGPVVSNVIGYVLILQCHGRIALDCFDNNLRLILPFVGLAAHLTPDTACLATLSTQQVAWRVTPNPTEFSVPSAPIVSWLSRIQKCPPRSAAASMSKER